MNRFRQASCYGCLAGSYQDASGQYGCKSCSSGKYTDSTRQASCKLCDIGKYQVRHWFCAAGQARTPSTHSRLTFMALSLPVTVRTEVLLALSSRKSLPFSCAAFHHGSATHDDYVHPLQGDYAPIPGLSRCSECPSGKSQPQTGQADCIGECVELMLPRHLRDQALLGAIGRRF